jgi:hypothetical protein
MVIVCSVCIDVKGKRINELPRILSLGHKDRYVIGVSNLSLTLLRIVSEDALTEAHIL